MSGANNADASLLLTKSNNQTPSKRNRTMWCDNCLLLFPRKSSSSPSTRRAQLTFVRFLRRFYLPLTYASPILHRPRLLPFSFLLNSHALLLADLSLLLAFQSVAARWSSPPLLLYTPLPVVSSSSSMGSTSGSPTPVRHPFAGTFTSHALADPSWAFCRASSPPLPLPSRLLRNLANG